MPRPLDTSSKLDSKSSEFASLGETFRPADNPYKLGEEGSGTRKLSKVQDFYALKKRHCSNNLFEDVEFPAKVSSIIPPEMLNSYEGYLKEEIPNIKWLRPKDIVKSAPKFFVKGSSRFDMKQGSLGDCWFLASLASVAEHPNLISRVALQCQEYYKDFDDTIRKNLPEPDCQVFDDDNYAGIFHFRFWQFGSWVDVVIDDRLPTIDEELVFANSSQQNEFWCALVEKAYAKLHGSYLALEGGLPSKALEDLTGGICTSYELYDREFDLVENLIEAQDRNALITFSSLISEEIPTFTTSNTSIIKSHVYSLTEFFPEEKERLLKLRNPWGSGEWIGKWSDKWVTQYISKRRQKLLDFKEEVDGEFLMPLERIKSFFSDVDICYFDPVPPTDKKLTCGIREWEFQAIAGEWVPAVKLTAGKSNPICLVTLEAPEGASECEVIVGLTQNTLRSVGDDNLAIGFFVSRVWRDQKNDEKISSMGIVHSHLPIEMHTVSSHLRMPPGTYCIFPQTSEPHQSGKFALRILSKGPFTMRMWDPEVDTNEIEHTE